jgi:uncharacterized RDD family membrane protein YckC
MVIDGIDFVIGVMLVAGVLALCAKLEMSIDAQFGLSLGVWLGYFVVVKWAMRTVGYRVMGMKLVNLKGARAGFWSTLLRAAFMFLGPINYVVDLLWMMSNGNRQALRDQLLGTYVVKVNSQPLGVGPIVWENCHLMGYNFIVGEVKGSRGS